MTGLPRTTGTHSAYAQCVALCVPVVRCIVRVRSASIPGSTSMSPSSSSSLTSLFSDHNDMSVMFARTCCKLWCDILAHISSSSCHLHFIGIAHVMCIMQCGTWFRYMLGADGCHYMACICIHIYPHIFHLCVCCLILHTLHPSGCRPLMVSLHDMWVHACIPADISPVCCCIILHTLHPSGCDPWAGMSWCTCTAALRHNVAHILLTTCPTTHNVAHILLTTCPTTHNVAHIVTREQTR